METITTDIVKIKIKLKMQMLARNHLNTWIMACFIIYKCIFSKINSLKHFLYLIYRKMILKLRKGKMVISLKMKISRYTYHENAIFNRWQFNENFTWCYFSPLAILLTINHFLQNRLHTGTIRKTTFVFNKM